MIGSYVAVSGVSLNMELKHSIDLTYEEDQSIDPFVNTITGNLDAKFLSLRLPIIPLHKS